MKKLQTIENIHRVYDTGSKPVLVTCNDLNFWVCKSARDPMVLFNELIASEFAKIWQIKVPETGLITVLDEHVSEEFIPQIQKNWFKKDCFGSFFLDNAKEFDHTTLPLFTDRNFRNKFKTKSDFLNIALFDIWMANDDRNHNNFNLLFDTADDGFYFFFAFDHGAVFNTSSLNYGLEQQTESDTILNTDLARILFSKNKNIKNIINDLIIMYYLRTLECKEKLPEILAMVPESWNVNLEELEKKILESIFSDEWIKKCEQTFRQYVQIFILN